MAERVNVIVYSAPWCAPCKTLLKAMRARSWTVVDIEERDMTDAKHRVGPDGVALTSPPTVYVDGKRVASGASEVLAAVDRRVQQVLAEGALRGRREVSRG